MPTVVRSGPLNGGLESGAPWLPPPRTSVAARDSEVAHAPTDALPRRESDPTILGACVGECSSCGDRNRVVIVTSERVLSRCLRCQDEAILDAPPAWCRMVGLPQQVNSTGEYSPLIVGARSDHEIDDAPGGRAGHP